MNDSGVRRNDREVLESCLSPAQERVALFVALEFEFGIEQESLGCAEFIDLHRVINH